MSKDKLTVSAKTDELKRCIHQTFQLTNLNSLQGLSDSLKSLGQQSTAFALEQLINSENSQPLEKPKKIPTGVQDISAFPIDK